MSAQFIEKHLIDLTLLSGSGCKLRTGFGQMYYEVVSGAAEGEAIEFIDYGGFTTTLYPETPLRWASNYDLVHTPAASGAILPSYKFPVRLSATEDTFASDTHWLSYILGGSPEADVTYPGIYNRGVFDDYAFERLEPYSYYQRKWLHKILGAGGSDYWKVTPRYNHYLREYQERVGNTTSETHIPNIYLLDLIQKEGLSMDIDSAALRFASLDDAVDDTVMQALFDDSYSDYFPPHEDTVYETAGYVDETYNLREYLNTYANSSLSQSVVSDIQEPFQNILFDYSASFVNDLMLDLDIDFFATVDVTHKWPFCVDIQLPRGASTGVTVRQSLIDRGTNSRFLKLLKECFLEELPFLPTQTMTYGAYTNYTTAQKDSTDGSIQSSEVNEYKAVDYKYIDFLTFMKYAHNTYNSQNNNCFFMRGNDLESLASYDSTNTYRFYNSATITEVLDDFYIYLDEDPKYNLESIEELFQQADETKHTEILAYRIEKRDQATTDSIQNFWFFNMPSDSTETVDVDGFSGEGEVPGNLRYYDTQVKYGKSYTYNLYAYSLIVGYKYEVGDLVITQQINTASATGTYCLEFYNGHTGQTSPQLFELWEDNQLSGSDADGPLNTFATNAQVLSDYPYLADFNLSYEPAARIIEFPLGSKDVTVLDNCGPAFEIAPFQFFDDSRRLGFEVIREAENTEPLPPAILPEEAALIETYKVSHDLLEGEEITVDSLSRIETLRVYRVESRPFSYAAVGATLHSTIDLRIPDSEYTVTRTIFTDKVNTNTPYYYLFVGLSANGMPTHVSSIYEATLVDDGGYKYATFETITEQDFNVESFGSPFEEAKNLIQIRPKFEHIYPNSNSVDLTADAVDQIEDLIVGNAGDLVWDRTFKIRLTSKKTGKKVDLNLTYKLESDY